MIVGASSAIVIEKTYASQSSLIGSPTPSDTSNEWDYFDMSDVDSFFLPTLDLPLMAELAS